MPTIPDTVTRRGVLAALGASLGGATGCLAGGRPDSGGHSDGDGPVSLLVAGSLYNALENGLRNAVNQRIQIEGRGSTTVTRLVASGQKDPDIVSVADVALFEGPLEPPWFSEFATNAMVLAYTTETPGGRQVDAADRWYRPLLEDDVSLGRTDPDLDPLGYRTLFVLELASDHYGLNIDLREEIPERDQLYPETQLVSQFETGSVDAAFTYRSMAVNRGYDYYELPDRIDLSAPRYADTYGGVSYELASGHRIRGSPISYASTIRTQNRAVRHLFTRLTTGSYLHDFGFGVPKSYPIHTGNVPDKIAG